jgi:tRNA (adenine57-N1/adenine58-N1)-methyltransferase
MSGELAAGDLVQLIDNKGRRYQAVLEAGKEFHSHSGFIPHEDSIGQPVGCTVKTSVPTSWPRIRIPRPVLCRRA